MNIEELLAEAAKLGPWGELSKINIGYIRCAKGDCPIVAVANSKRRFTTESFQNHSWEDAANFLGLDLRLAERVVEAADNPHAPLRQQLLAALGLEEPTRHDHVE